MSQENCVEYSNCLEWKAVKIIVVVLIWVMIREHRSYRIIAPLPISMPRPAAVSLCLSLLSLSPQISVVGLTGIRHELLSAILECLLLSAGRRYCCVWATLLRVSLYFHRHQQQPWTVDTGILSYLFRPNQRKLCVWWSWLCELQAQEADQKQEEKKEK